MFCHSPQCQGKAAEKGHVLMVAELGMKTRTENQIILRQAPNIDHGCQLFNPCSEGESQAGPVCSALFHLQMLLVPAASCSLS